jgi:UDP-N-acetylmuramyl pentapeptide synthase
MQTLKINKTILQEIFADEPSFHEFCKLWDVDVPLTIDSRFVPPQSIFFAIKGDINDGHNFIQDALLNGAALVIASASKREELKIASMPVIFVKDTLECFSKLAHRHLMSMKALRIAITGSNGKTTVKEMTKAALSAVLGEDLVYASRGTFNNHFGVPISALEGCDL